MLALTAVTVGGTEQPRRTDGSVSHAEVIAELKDFERTLNFEETGNFKKQKQSKKAYYRCYYTDKFELPSSYEELKLRYGNQSGCSIDEEKYDVFFYPIEAVASGNAPVTSSLASATVERLLVVVPHEDFHEDERIRSLPTFIAEAATTLIGFLTARQFALEKFGEASQEHQNLSSEADLFLRKAEIINSYHARLSALYASLRSGEMDEQQVLRMKAQLFGEMQGECEAIVRNPSSFNKCVSEDNNAGLAFDMTYTKYYPLMYELHVTQGRDVRKTIEALQLAAERRPRSQEEAVEYLRELEAVSQTPCTPRSP